MLIISDFKDFYDYGCVYGIDKKHVYKRKTEVLEIKNTKTFSKDVIGFCGKIYILYNLFNINVFSEDITDKKINVFNNTSYISLCGEKFGYINKNHKSNFILKEHIPQKIVNKYYDDKINQNEFECKIKEHVGIVKDSKNNWLDYNFDKNQYLYIFEKHKVPIFYVHNNKLYLNPPLKKLGFQKYITPVEAFQEIEMFLTKLTDPPDPVMPVGDDKLIAGTHGFDKYSFRKEKEKK